MAPSHHVGQRLSYEKALCTVRYIGEVAGTSGTWLGVEWDDPARGKHDGSHKGVRYFTCLSKSSTAASFVRPTRPADEPQSFISALRDKYASGAVKDVTGTQIAFSGKVVEEVGFDKVQRQLAKVEDLKIVILDGSRVAIPVAKDEEKSIRETCPRITDLDLSRNLFEKFGAVVKICRELDALKSLRLNGNRFQEITDVDLEGSEAAFRGVKEVALEETLLSWEKTWHIATNFPSLTSLNAGSNQLRSLSPISFGHSASNLTSLNLEFNEFTSFSDISSLTTLTALRNLHLKGNSIAVISSTAAVPVFPACLQYLDISYNNITTWSFVDDLPAVFPGMTALRLAHNPIYDNPDPDNILDGKALTDEAFTITIGRLTRLKTLNFVSISAADRTNAEMFYLSRIAKHMALVPETAEEMVIKQHKRYAELCELYGEPDIIRSQQINPNFLEARLVTVAFQYKREAEGEHKAKTARKTIKIPKSFDIYAVKGIAGKLFGLPPLELRLVYETGEWDPVAGFDEVGNSSEEEEAEAEHERDDRDGGNYGVEGKTGRFVKREVELKEGPRQLGFCVDGLEVKIRVELREVAVRA